MLDLDRYTTLVFDCDGVVLNSNKVKTEAFRLAALPYGQEAADALVEHHVNNGGISRYRKFEHFLAALAPGERKVGELNELLANYATYVRDGLMNCEIAEGLAELRQATSGSRWLIVSGGDQAELREVFAARAIAHFFDGGIFGSPDTKEQILDRELETGNVRRPALFLGDSRYDFQAAKHIGIDFLFVSSWTEFSHWGAFAADNKLPTVSSIAEFAHSLVHNCD